MNRGYWGMWFLWFVPRLLLVLAALVVAGYVGARYF